MSGAASHAVPVEFGSLLGCDPDTSCHLSTALFESPLRYPRKRRLQRVGLLDRPIRPTAQQSRHLGTDVNPACKREVSGNLGKIGDVSEAYVGSWTWHG